MIGKPISKQNFTKSQLKNEIWQKRLGIITKWSLTITKKWTVQLARNKHYNLIIFHVFFCLNSIENQNLTEKNTFKKLGHTKIKHLKKF